MNEIKLIIVVVATMLLGVVAGAWNWQPPGELEYPGMRVEAAVPDAPPKVTPVTFAQLDTGGDVPFEIGYQWSWSGRQYVFASRSITAWNRLSFDGVAGYELLGGTIPSLGLGLSYGFDNPATGGYLKAGAYLLFPQKNKLDVALGLVAGWRR